MGKKEEKAAALEAIQKARTMLLLKQPFYGVLSMHLNLVCVDDESFWPAGNCTMAVDGVNEYYYPKFVLSLKPAELEGVQAHEVSHCAYQHMSRRGQRIPEVWNWAGDYVINADLLKAGFTLPAKRLHDPKFDGMSTEEVYARLMKDVKIIKLSMGGGKPGDKGGCGAVWDAPGGAQGQAASATEWEGTVRMAAATAARNAGTLPGHLERLVGLLKKPRISWRELTRNWIDQTMTNDYSWARPNRRHLSNDIVLPGFVPDALHHLIMIADVSGSVSQALMEAMLAEVGGCLDDGVADKLTVAYVDTRICGIDEYFPGDVVKCQVHAGGGTDFRPGFQWVKENAEDASGIVYLTDMYPCTWEIPDPELPTLWGAYATEQLISTLNVPFGDIVPIDGPEV